MILGRQRRERKRTVAPQNKINPNVTIGPRFPIRSEIIPHAIFVRSRIQAPMLVIAFARSRSKPKDTTSDGA